MSHKLRNLLAVFVAALTALAVTPAFAASITINPSDTTGTDNITYTAYKIFDATKTTDGNGVAYYVDASSPWLSVLQNQNQTWVTLTATADGSRYTVTKNDTLTDSTAANFASYLNSNKPSTLTGDYAAKSFTKDGTSYKTGDIDEGYYLVTSSLGDKLILDTTSSTTINEKNEYPGDAKVKETASVSIGENATYYVVVTVPANVDPDTPIVVHDQLPEQLSFNDDVQVYSVDTGTTGAPTTSSDAAALKALTYTTLPSNVTVATSDATLQANDTFTISIDNSSEETSLAGKTLVFKYSAQLLSTAASDTGYVNREFITYDGYTSNTKTQEVKTYDFDVNKTKSDGSALTGAEFELRTEANTDSTAIAFITKDGGYKKADKDDTNTVTTLTAGKINLEGLGAGTYYLVETKAPDGYNKLQSAITVTIDDDGTITFAVGEGNNGTAKADTGDQINVVNNSGSELPSTGGMGTTIFTVVGSVLVIGAACAIVARKRMEK